MSEPNAPPSLPPTAAATAAAVAAATAAAASSHGSEATQYQPKRPAFSRFFRRYPYNERRSRAVAPAETTSLNHDASLRRRKAGTSDLAKARESVAQLNQRHRLRLQVGEFMQQLYVELFFVLIVLLYGIFVVVQIAMDESDLESIQTVINVTDITVGSILLVEIVLKLFAFGMAYLSSGWSIFDATVIVASFVLGIVAATGTTSYTLLRILRLRVILRILRVLVVFERLKQRSRTMKFVHRGQLTSPVEHVLRILNELRYHPALRSALRNDVEFVIEVIKSNRLYDANEELLAGEVDNDTQNWLRGEILKVKDTAKVLPDADEMDGSKSHPTESRRSNSGSPTHAQTIQSLQESPVTGMRRGVTMKELLPPMDDASAEFELQNLLRDIGNWTFDIFRVQIITNGNALCHVGYHLLHDLASSSLLIEQSTLVNFLLEIQRGYVTSNPYHNAIHAADVMQTVYYFLCQPELGPFLRPLDRALALIAAGIHDFKHDGFNNSFHISTASEIALRYNDHAVLENFHVAQSFLVMKNAECNVLGHLSQEDFKYSREMIIQMVLATDMAKHFEDVALFKTNILPSSPDQEFTIKSVGDKKLLLKMILHTCDVSNPAKEREIMLKWTDRVVEEFFLQGDLEKQLQLAVSPFMDRDTIVLKKMQVGFADFIVTPLFTIWAQILANVNAVAYKTLLSNREFWASLTEEFKPHMIKDVIRELGHRKRLSVVPESPTSAPSPNNPQFLASMSTGRPRRSITNLLLSSEDV